ncbi:secretion protein [Flavobacterium ginsengiterrae]
MKYILYILLSLNAAQTSAQIYFSPNAFLYAKNEVLYVGQNITMASSSNLYLRNNSQLLQGSSSLSQNSGQGTLSVYQEGTADNFDYNYWCSPVGNASSASGNENFGITMLHRPTSPVLSTPATLLPAGSYDGTSNPLSIASSWIYKLVNAGSYSQWIYVGNTAGLQPGEGFTMKGTSGTDLLDPAQTGTFNNPGGAQRYDFRGKPNDGNITVVLGAGAATLTGNPYPSALHLNAFLLDPSNVVITGGTAYFWEQDKSVNSHYLSAYKGGYGAYAPVSLLSDGIYTPPVFNSYNQDGSLNTGTPASGSGTPIQRRYSPIGQGFLLNGTAAGTAIFRNSHRIFVKEASGGSQFEKSAGIQKPESRQETVTPVSHIKFNTIINNQFTRQLALAFTPDATDGVDPGVDAVNISTDLPNDLGFWLENASYVIEGINFDLSKQIPLVVKAAVNSTFKFYISDIINFDQAQPVYLYDMLDGSYHNIAQTPFQVSVAPGIYTERFKITFTSKTLGVRDYDSDTQFFIFHNDVQSSVTAVNPGMLPIESYKLYDVNSRMVRSENNLTADLRYAFSTSGLSAGVYIAVFHTNDGRRLTGKIIISAGSH